MSRRFSQIQTFYNNFIDRIFPFCYTGIVVFRNQEKQIRFISQGKTIFCEKEGEAMKRKLICVVALILCLSMVLLCGCNSKKTDTDTSSSPSGENEPVGDILDDESTTTGEETTVPADEVKQPASSAMDKVTSVKTDKVNTTTPSVKKDEWKAAGKYTCGKNLSVGEYYIVPTGKNCSVKITDGKHLDADEILEFDVLPFGLFVTMQKGYTLEISGGKFIASSAVSAMGKNGSYELGSYRVGVDIAAGETTIKVADGAGYMIFDSSDYFDEDNMVYIGAGYYPEYVNLKKGQVIWFLDNATVGAKVAGAKSDGSYGEGMYKVGKDIQPGKYDLIPTDGENSYAIYYDLKFAEISYRDYGDNIESTTVVTLASGEYIEFIGCKLVPHVDATTTQPVESTTEPNSETTTDGGESTSETTEEDSSAPSSEQTDDTTSPEPAGDSSVSE